MRSTVEPLEGNKVRLSIEVDADEFEQEVDRAFGRMAREARVPGFRPGKVPRRLLEARVGTAAARADALQHAIPGWYEEAVVDHEVDIIAQPEIDITEGTESGPVTVDAVVEVRPQINLGGYESLRITIPHPMPTPEEIEARVDQLRDQFAELTPVDRPARDGDHVSIDISGSQHGEPLSGLTAEDYLYEVGAGTVVEQMDVELGGAKVGDILSFVAPHPDPEVGDVDFRILVKEVQEKVLPVADDAFAEEASEFDSLDELRADLAQRLTTAKRVQAQMALQQRTAEALADLVSEDVPEALVNTEMQRRLEDMALRLRAQGVTLEQYVEATGQDSETFVAELRQTATAGARVDLALRALSEAEGIEVTDADLEAEYAEVAERAQQPLDRVRRQFEESDQMSSVRADLKKRKALAWLLEHVEIVDEDGQRIDRASLEIADTDTDTGDPEAGDAENPEPENAEPTIQAESAPDFTTDAEERL